LLIVVQKSGKLGSGETSALAASGPLPGSAS